MSNVTVVISNYNYGDYVASAIESCLAQTVKPNIIVVDDHSTDKSWKVISKYKGRIQAVRLARNSKGNARGKNVGIAMSTTPFVTCLDSDDMLVPHSLECRLNAIGDADFCHGWAYQISSKGSYQQIMKLKPAFGDRKARKRYGEKIDGKYKQLTKGQAHRYAVVIPASTVLARRSLYDELGLYDEWLRWKIDKEMWARWLRHGKRPVVIRSFVSIYRKHGRNVTMTPAIKKPKETNARCRQVTLARRHVVDSSNTLMLNDYNYKQFIGVAL